MSGEPVFNLYDGWPAENSRIAVPRLSESAARKLLHGLDLVEERGTTMGRYTIREYRNPETGEYVYVGGDFTVWPDE